jgi:hypothetical protein
LAIDDLAIDDLIDDLAIDGKESSIYDRVIDNLLGNPRIDAWHGWCLTVRA